MRANGQARWQRRYDDAVAAGKVRDADFGTLSGTETEPVYGPDDRQGRDRSSST